MSWHGAPVVVVVVIVVVVLVVVVVVLRGPGFAREVLALSGTSVTAATFRVVILPLDAWKAKGSDG